MGVTVDKPKRHANDSVTVFQNQIRERMEASDQRPVVRETDAERQAIMYSIAREVCRIHDVPWNGDGNPWSVELANIGDDIRAEKSKWYRDE